MARGRAPARLNEAQFGLGAHVAVDAEVWNPLLLKIPDGLLRTTLIQAHNSVYNESIPVGVKGSLNPLDVCGIAFVRFNKLVLCFFINVASRSYSTFYLKLLDRLTILEYDLTSGRKQSPNGSVQRTLCPGDVVLAIYLESSARFFFYCIPIPEF